MEREEAFKEQFVTFYPLFSDQGFCNTWLVTKIKVNLSAKSKEDTYHCICWAKILHNSAVKVRCHNCSDHCMFTCVTSLYRQL